MLKRPTLIAVCALAVTMVVGCEAIPTGEVQPPSTPANTLPSAPASLSAAGGSAKVTLTWAPSDSAGTYNVKRSITRGGPYTQIATTSSPAYTDTAVTNDVKYYYIVTVVGSTGESRSSNEASATPQELLQQDSDDDDPPPSVGDGSDCNMQLATSPAIFCDTFDAPAPNGNRSGDLDGDVWGASRTGPVNFGQGEHNVWNPTLLEGCDGTLPERVLPPNDIIICDGEMREAANDNTSGAWDAGAVNALTIYPKQPFDFAGRTGTVSFDVSNDTAGTHAAWPEFWMSNLPVPGPFNHFDSWQSNPQHGFGIRFAGAAGIGQYGSCPNGNNLDKYRWTVDSAVVFRNYVYDDTNGYGARQVQLAIKDCVVSSSGAGIDMNHVEIRVAQNKIEVWATDAGVTPTPQSLKLIAELTNANLSFTRGLIWIDDVHYNADKGPSDRPSQREHTFAWDNVAFDGPFTYRDFSYDAPDNTGDGPYDSQILGKFANANQTTSWSIPNMPANRQAAVVRVLFNAFAYEKPDMLNVIVNGHAHSMANPYPDSRAYTWRTFAVTIDIDDLVTGTNMIQLGADSAQSYSNVNVVLVDVPNGVPVLPGSDNTYPN